MKIKRIFEKLKDLKERIKRSIEADKFANRSNKRIR